MEGIGTRRGKRRTAAVLLLLFLVIATKAPALECPISVNNTNYLNHPDISGDRIVWEGAGDIYLFNFADGNETRLTSDAIAQSSPFISSSLVTWNEGDSILLQDLST
ncbi:MAG: hypothetical protein LUO97_06340, partial [Methanomicrobiales archaeon]|nr:hypothetical protein [Methanomicrobiales archaeon]